MSQPLAGEIDFWESMRGSYYVAMTSGGFDPLHIGHLRSIRQMKIAVRDSLLLDDPTIKIIKPILTVVVVNGTNFLIQKKGFEFMPLSERMEIVRGLVGVDIVTSWDQEGADTSVIEAIKIIQPHFFCKGGDRTKESGLVEGPICETLGTTVIYNVGGGKIQSSSELVSAAPK